MLVYHIWSKVREASAVIEGKRVTVLIDSKRIGTLIGDLRDNTVIVSWAATRKTQMCECGRVSVKADAFSPRLGIAIATAKMTIPNYPAGKIPITVLKELPRFMARWPSDYRHIP